MVVPSPNSVPPCTAVKRPLLPRISYWYGQIIPLILFVNPGFKAYLKVSLFGKGLPVELGFSTGNTEHIKVVFSFSWSEGVRVMHRPSPLISLELLGHSTSPSSVNSIQVHIFGKGYSLVQLVSIRCLMISTFDLQFIQDTLVALLAGVTLREYRNIGT